jgi:predicted ATPase
VSIQCNLQSAICFSPSLHERRAGSRAAMLDPLSCVVALSVELEPLRSADETAALVEAMAKFPDGMPKRAAHVAAHLEAVVPGCVMGVHQVPALLRRLSKASWWSTRGSRV